MERDSRTDFIRDQTRLSRVICSTPICPESERLEPSSGGGSGSVPRISATAERSGSAIAKRRRRPWSRSAGSRPKLESFAVRQAYGTRFVPSVD